MYILGQKVISTGSQTHTHTCYLIKIIEHLMQEIYRKRNTCQTPGKQDESGHIDGSLNNY